MTFSVVARCPSTGRFGVAVASCVVAVGSRIPAVRPGVGAVVVQAGGWLQWRQALLDLLDRGLTADEATAAIMGLSEHDDLQVAAVGAAGDAVARTDAGCGPAAGHVGGGPASAQANTMASDDTWPAMLAAYEAADEFADGLVAALAAADAEGGDLRGRQSAALLIAGADRGQLPTGDADDPTVDLRVDDATDPVDELAGLVEVHRAQRHVIRAGMATDDDTVQAEVRQAADLAPADPVCAPVAAIALALHGRLDEALPMLEQAVTVNPATARWARARAARAGTDDPNAQALLDELDRLERP